MSKNMLLLAMVGSGLLLFGCEMGDDNQQTSGGDREAINGGDSKKPPAPNISIHEAAEKGDLEAIKKHIAAGTNINSQNARQGETPLHRAATRGQTEAAKLLIDSGCDINIGRSDGTTPLDLAESRGSVEIAKLLRAKGAK